MKQQGVRNEAVAGPFTVRDLTVFAATLVLFIASLIPMFAVRYNLWNLGSLFFLGLGVVLPLIVAALFVARRLAPETKVRIGSLSVDQFGSVVASFAVAFFFLSVAGAYTPSLLVGLIGSLVLLAATVLARFIPFFAGDFLGRPDVPAHIMARDSAVPVRKPKAPKEPKAAAAKPAAAAPVLLSAALGRWLGGCGAGSRWPAVLRLGSGIPRSCIPRCDGGRPAGARCSPGRHCRGRNSRCYADIAGAGTAAAGAGTAGAGPPAQRRPPGCGPPPTPRAAPQRRRKRDRPPSCPPRRPVTPPPSRRRARHRRGTEGPDAGRRRSRGRARQAEQTQLDGATAAPAAAAGAAGSRKRRPRRRPQRKPRSRRASPTLPRVKLRKRPRGLPRPRQPPPSTRGWRSQQQVRSQEPIGATVDPASRPEESEQEQVHEAFWFAVAQHRTAVDERTGAPLFGIEPGGWVLALEDRGDEFLVQHTDGRVGVLRDLSNIERG